jgi:hypothetical protein
MCYRPVGSLWVEASKGCECIFFFFFADLGLKIDNISFSLVGLVAEFGKMS